MRKLSVLTLVVCLVSCTRNSVTELDPSEILHQNQDQLTEVIIYDVFSPPVASRLYVYAALASFEAVRFSAEGTSSLTERLRGFDPMPQPVDGKEYDFILAASKAFFNVVHNVKVFSVDSLRRYEESLFDYFRQRLDDSVYARSAAFGDSIAHLILKRAKGDGYAESRGKPKFIGLTDPGKWRATPPDYLDGVEWCWNTMMPMIMDSAAQFRPAAPPEFTFDTKSIYYQNLMEVYNIDQNLTHEQIEIARYWDDNPMVIEHSGHLMFANKKITPGGHWMGICAIASKMTDSDPVKTAAAYALTAIALYDGFISCWDEKYKSVYIRPVTVINDSIDATWLPYLQTPPFPEYPSGHSVISGAASNVLTSVFGENFAFRDTSDLRYIGMERNFNSFKDAAYEASVSRVYGGIHYRFSVDIGLEMGNKLGDLIAVKLMDLDKP